MTFQKDNLQKYLSGQLLIAMPHIQDKRFEQAVIYVCSHDANGAIGLMINRTIDTLTLSNLFEQLDIADHKFIQDTRIYYGGPVEMGRGFVLHSDQEEFESTVNISDGIALTATLDILKRIALDQGPEKKLCILGYSGWNSGQLELEIQQNIWLQVAADSYLVFDCPIEQRWQQAIRKIGIHPKNLIHTAGHA